MPIPIPPFTNCFSSNKYQSAVLIYGLPLKPIGEAEMKIVFSLDVNGTLNVYFYSVDNGNYDNFTANISHLTTDAE